MRSYSNPNDSSDSNWHSNPDHYLALDCAMFLIQAVGKVDVRLLHTDTHKGWDNVVFCSLHCMMRVTEKLLRLLAEHAYGKKLRNVQQGIHPGKQQHNLLVLPVLELQQAVRDKCGLSSFCAFKKQRTSTAAMWDDSWVGVSKLAGWECKKILEHAHEIVAASGDTQPETLQVWTL